MNARHLLLEILDAALRAVDGEARVVAALREWGSRPVALCAIGKAAEAMTRGAYRAMGTQVRTALVITKDGHASSGLAKLPRLQMIESAHPVPDGRSLEAGKRLERWIASLPVDVHPVFLISGGSSSLVELLQPGVTLETLRELNRHGLAAGWDIRRLNRERAKLSRLKSGGVSRLLGGRPAHALFLSDVPEDDPAVIGSGLLGPDPGGDDQVRRIVVASIEDAMRRAVEVAAAHGLEARLGAERFAGEAREVALTFVEALRQGGHELLVWGGESTVTLPPRAGRGGRNQHLALCAARALHAREDITILAVGTDGTDGPTPDAGAIVDAGTIGRAEIGGVDVERALRDFDSGLALEAAQDLVHTGPTGTNVGDLLIGIRGNATRVRDPAMPRML
jgi:glycerate 2-kinase